MRLALLLAIALLSSGCSSLGAPRDAAYDDIDREKMATIEQRAWSSGARVYWVDPPRKSATPGG